MNRLISDWSHLFWEFQFKSFATVVILVCKYIKGKI